MGKKNYSKLRTFYRTLTGKEALLSVCLQGLNAVACYLYLLTLEGGDVDQLKEKAPYFGCLLYANIAIIIVIAYLLVNFFRFGVRIANFLLIGLACLVTFTWDLGTDLQNHGQFNLVMYFLFWLPIVLGVVVYKLSKFIKSFVSNKT